MASFVAKIVVCAVVRAFICQMFIWTITVTGTRHRSWCRLGWTLRLVNFSLWTLFTSAAGETVGVTCAEVRWLEYAIALSPLILQYWRRPWMASFHCRGTLGFFAFSPGKWGLQRTGLSRQFFSRHDPNDFQTHMEQQHIFICCRHPQDAQQASDGTNGIEKKQ